MENSFLVFTERENVSHILRFHFCSWEFNNNTSLVEFGFELSSENLNRNQCSISLFIPWITTNCSIRDLYDRLSTSENSRFIFNDSVKSTYYLDDGRNKLGTTHSFSSGNDLCILPFTYTLSNSILTINVNLEKYNEVYSDIKPNVYCRLSIKPKTQYISMRKKGSSKSTVIYDIKVNEKRNIPDNLLSYFANKEFCKIDHCFCLNIIPNKYDIVFIENPYLKNVRTLEFDSFNKYLGDNRVKENELIVVFNKKSNLESYSFFSIFNKERIGPGQFALAILINILCGCLLFIPSFRKSFQPPLSLLQVWRHLPVEVFISLSIAFIMLLFFTWPSINMLGLNIGSWVKSIFKKKKQHN